MAQAKRVRLRSRSEIEAVEVPSEGYSVVYDESERELGLRVNAGGRRTWFALFRRDGRTERVTLGAFPEVTSDLARAKLRRIRREIHVDGVTPREASLAKRAEPTLRDAFDLYIEKRFAAHGRKATNERSMFDLYLAPWADWKLSDITRGHVEHLIADIPGRKRRRWRSQPRPDGTPELVLVETEETVSGSMANHVLRFLRAMFNFARSQYEAGAREPFYSGPNPTDGIEKHEETPVERRLRHDEIKRFFSALAEEPDRDFRDFVLVSLWTGARSGNTRAMRWADVDLESGEWTLTVRKGRPKRTGELRQKNVTVALAAPVLTLLAARRSKSTESEFVFPSRSRTGHIDVPKKAWARLLTRARVKSLRIHDLRHSTASWAAESGASGPMIQALLAHSDPKMTARYTHIQSTAMREAADAMAAFTIAKGGVSIEDLTRH